MINTGPSNDKIYQRCVALIGDLVIRKTCGAVLATRQHIQLHEKVHSNLPAFRADVPLQQERLLLCADGSVVVSTTSLIAAAAELCLLKSIYASDRLSDKICSANISDHIKFYLAQVNSPCVVRNDAVSNDIVAVLPVAFLLATSAFDFLLFDEALQREVKVDTISSPRSSWTVQSAAAALKMEPRVSKLLKDILQLK